MDPIQGGFGLDLWEVESRRQVQLPSIKLKKDCDRGGASRVGWNLVDDRILSVDSFMPYFRGRAIDRPLVELSLH